MTISSQAAHLVKLPGRLPAEWSMVRMGPGMALDVRFDSVVVGDIGVANQRSKTNEREGSHGRRYTDRRTGV
jgi:hypothetical protein